MYAFPDDISRHTGDPDPRPARVVPAETNCRRTIGGQANEMISPLLHVSRTNDISKEMTEQQRDSTNQTTDRPLCPVCASSLMKRLFTKKERTYWRCMDCGLEKQHPLPSWVDLAAYYETSYQDGMYRLFSDADGIKTATAQLRFDSLSKYGRRGRWLDVGCSAGYFVACANQHQMQCEGIDLSAVAIETGAARGLSLHASTIEDWKPGYTYETLTCFDVLEHVLDPRHFLECARDLLSSRGTIVLTVPNLASLTRAIMGKYWYFYIPEEHLHLFRPDTLERLLTSVGFEITHRTAAYKPLTFNYSLTQFKEYNPTIHSILASLGRAIPTRLADAVIPLPIGEMTVVAIRRD